MDGANFSILRSAKCIRKYPLIVLLTVYPFITHFS